MKELSLIIAISMIVIYTHTLDAAYLLNGKPSVVGAYAYDQAPKTGTAFKGDIDKKFVSFANGALMDAKGDNLGKSVGFASAGDNTYIRTVFVDLGQVVILESIAVKSQLAAWWHLGSFEVSFSTDGKAFINRINRDGFSASNPHSESLAADLNVNTNLPKARYIRFKFNIGSWQNEQIGEIDIIAKTLNGTEPLKKQIDLRNLKEIYKVQVESPMVDEFGQYTRDEWPGKIHSENELREKLQKEYKKYENVKIDMAKFDRFGGCKTLGIKAKATGKWYLDKINGRWWFITPEGNPFIMIAVDGVDLVGDRSNTNTVEYPGRPEIAKNYSKLPPKTGLFADCWWKAPKGWWGAEVEGIWRFDYFHANMIRAFGKDAYLNNVDNLTNRRLVAWGFNSFGKWNWRGQIGNDPKLPYITVEGPTPDKGVTLKMYNGDFIDPWDPNLTKSVENTIRNSHAKFGDDPYYIGFTIGNEGWWGIEVTKDMLKSVPAGPAKKEFIARLKSSYKTIAGFNKECGLNVKSFDELGNMDLNPLEEKLKDKISTFIEESSRKFYSTWRDAVNKYDSGRLILGSSFVIWWLSCPEWVRGSIPYCDAMMLDDYPLAADGIIKNYVDAFAVPADKPVLIGEYSFTTTQRGFKPFRGDRPTHKDRGVHYKSFNEKLFAHPNWVGSMWFIYRDEVPVGRNLDGGGESHNFGLVDICNMPYYDMIDVMKDCNAKLFEIHAGKVVSE